MKHVCFCTSFNAKPSVLKASNHHVSPQLNLKSSSLVLPRIQISLMASVSVTIIFKPLNLPPSCLEGTSHFDGSVPAALDVSWAGRLDFWTDLPQHVAVIQGFKLCRAHYSFAPNLRGKKKKRSREVKLSRVTHMHVSLCPRI